MLTQWGSAALDLLVRHEPPDPEGLLPRVRERLASSPIQDVRLDFEDGYGWRGDAVEDTDARRAGQVLAGLPSTLLARGVRIKGLEPHERARAVRTLELVLDGTGGVPERFVFTVPKLLHPGQVDAVVAPCTGRRAAAPGCVTAPTTTAPRAGSRLRTSRWSTPSPTTPRT